MKSKILKNLRNYGYTNNQDVKKAEFIIDKVLKDVLKLIDEMLAEGIDVVNGIKYNLLINGEELKKRITGEENEN